MGHLNLKTSVCSLLAVAPYPGIRRLRNLASHLVEQLYVSFDLLDRLKVLSLFCGLL